MNSSWQKNHTLNFHCHNYKFLRGTPRTFREAFGEEMYPEESKTSDAVVLGLALVALVIVVVSTILGWRLG